MGWMKMESLGGGLWVVGWWDSDDRRKLVRWLLVGLFLQDVGGV